jgi:multidrug transporter EmrE-like cation transporter
MPSWQYTAYAIAAAIFYVAATFVMKYFDRVGVWKAVPLIGALFVGAVVTETVALRAERFAFILLLILAAECAIGAAVSILWFKDGYSRYEVAGFVFVVIGMGLLESGR